jgi:hypothetical protein
MAMYGGISIGIFIHLGALCYRFITYHYCVTFFFLGAWLHFLVTPIIIYIVHEASQIG